jgi:epoxide hydrolase 4
MLRRMPNPRTTASSDRLEDVRLQHRFVELDEVTLHCVEAGSGPLVLLLHGFPEFWYTWRSILPTLARAGFRVVAPDLRGYNLSSKPPGVASYANPSLASDIAQLIRELGSERANLIGHDWGANVVWSTAMYHPERVERLAVLNGPHPLRLLKGMLNPRQLLRSWYMFAIQPPRLAELFLSRDNFARMRKALSRDVLREGALTSDDLTRYTEAFAQPGALTAMLNYYRAAFRPSRPPKHWRIDQPALVLWGTQDPYLGRQLAQPGSKLVPRCRVEYVEQAGHYVHHDCPGLVGDALLAFLRSADAQV